MEFQKYYQDELAYMREMGELFSKNYPKLAPFLSHESNDPDVERLLEGFSFLTAKLRQKVEDEVPEFTEGLFASLWPHFLRPVPSMSILEFQPLSTVNTGNRRIPAGVEVESIAVEGTKCRFRTCYPVDVTPIYIEDVSVRSISRKSRLAIKLKSHNNVNFSELEMHSLRLYIHGDDKSKRDLFQALTRNVENIGYVNKETKDYTSIQGVDVNPVGFDAEDALIPYPDNISSAYRLLQEYFCFPEKFHFIDIKGIDRIFTSIHSDEVTLQIDISKELDSEVKLTKDSLKLFCSPIINIFSRDGDPIRRIREKTEYSLKPSGNPRHYQIFSVEDMYGSRQGDISRKPYIAYHGLSNRVQDYQEDEKAYYRLNYRSSIIDNEIETMVVFQDGIERGNWDTKKTEIIGTDLLCTNASLTKQLRVGDICHHATNTPEYIKFNNISRVSEPYPAPIHLNLDWALIGSLSLNFESLSSLITIKQLMSLYDTPSFYSKQAKRVHQLRLDGILSLESCNIVRILRDLPVNGIEMTFVVDSRKFSSESDMVLCFSVLNKVFELHSQINTFIETKVKDQETGETYRWTWEPGKRMTM